MRNTEKKYQKAVMSNDSLIRVSFRRMKNGK